MISSEGRFLSVYYWAILCDGTPSGKIGFVKMYALIDVDDMINASVALLELVEDQDDPEVVEDMMQKIISQWERNETVL